MNRLLVNYNENVKPELMKTFAYSSVMQVPQIEKIVINLGVAEAKDNAKALENAIRDLEIITGQKVVPTKAKKSIAGFKIREGMEESREAQRSRGDSAYLSFGPGHQLTSP